MEEEKKEISMEERLKIGKKAIIKMGVGLAIVVLAGVIGPIFFFYHSDNNPEIYKNMAIISVPVTVIVAVMCAFKIKQYFDFKRKAEAEKKLDTNK